MKALQDQSETTVTSHDEVKSTQTGPAESRRGIPKVRSGVNIAAIYVEAQEGQIMQKEMQFKQALDPV
jgi:hypothetical protein